jgi:DNA processing protein
MSECVVSPDLVEMGAYEALWDRGGASFKTVAEWCAGAPCLLDRAKPNGGRNGRALDVVPRETAEAYAEDIAGRLLKAGVEDTQFRIFGAPDYPAKLCDARYPLRAFYCRGNWDLLSTPTVAVVGARQLTEDGAARTRRLVRYLVKDGFTIVSGLAAGTDTVAHTTAIEMGGRTIAVLGTPLTTTYPRENAGLQRDIGDRFLVISQVPIIRYSKQDYRWNRMFFPERNITMCVLTDASIIAAIGESRGTYIQSRAAIDQGRPLFLLNNCFQKKGLDWPHKFTEYGAVRVREYEDIRSRIGHLVTA